MLKTKERHRKTNRKQTGIAAGILVPALLCWWLTVDQCLSRLGQHHPSADIGLAAGIAAGVQSAATAPDLHDSLGDGFPDGARLDHPEDRVNFTRWLTYLAEAEYYHPAPGAAGEIQDCAALIRYAFRNALAAHTPAWRESAEFPGALGEPGFGDVRKFSYPDWPLGRGLFRTRAGPLQASDLTDGTFAEFADTSTLLHFNAFFVSRDVGAAEPGDLLFFYQPGQREPYHSMLFVGRSYFQPQGSDWIVYHTGDLNGQRGEIREVEAHELVEHQDARWRPLEQNPRFLGVYRLEILR